ncbi:carbohydrate sulfotransferase 9-like [Convolutriloba macropyga]|uniref:carbohydrate sulfotransferase 9-like n=1 Tax=Convolutriloba macropyga TaxID=536237 RepID=UPI003F51F593
MFLTIAWLNIPPNCIQQRSSFPNQVTLTSEEIDSSSRLESAQSSMRETLSKDKFKNNIKDKNKNPDMNEEMHSNSGPKLPPKLRKFFNANLLQKPAIGIYKTAEDIQVERMKTLQRFCSSSNNRKIVSGKCSRGENGLVYLFEKYNAFECGVAKTGSSSRTRIFWPLFHNQTVPSSSKYEHRSSDKAVKKVTQNEITANPEKYRSYSTRFLFTRDPFNRALSGYFDKVERNGWLGGKNTSLSQYFGMSISGKTQNGHFAEQLSVCNPCALNITFVARTETFMNDLGIIVNNLTSMQEKIQISPTNQNLYDPSKPANKSKYDKNKIRSLSLDTIFEFIWAYRYDYLAYGFNPHNTLMQFLHMKGNSN